MKLTKQKLKQLMKEVINESGSRFKSRKLQQGQDRDKDNLIAEISEILRFRLQLSEVEGLLMSLQRDYPPEVHGDTHRRMPRRDIEPEAAAAAFKGHYTGEL